MSISPLKFTLQDRNTSVRSPILKFKFRLTSPLSAMRRGVLFGSAVFNTKNDRLQYRLEQLSTQPAGHSVPQGQPKDNRSDSVICSPSYYVYWWNLLSLHVTSSRLQFEMQDEIPPQKITHSLKSSSQSLEQSFPNSSSLKQKFSNLQPNPRLMQPILICDTLGESFSLRRQINQFK